MKPVPSTLALALAMSALSIAAMPAGAQEYRSFEDMIRRPNSGLRMESAPPSSGSFQQMLPSAPQAPAAPVQNLGMPPAGGSSFQQMLPGAPQAPAAPVQNLGAPPASGNPSFEQILPGTPSAPPQETTTPQPPAIRIDNPGGFGGAPTPAVRVENFGGFVPPAPSTRMPDTAPR